MNRTILFTLIFIYSGFVHGQSWTQLTDFPGTQRDDGCSFTINSKAFCFSGLEVGWQCTGNGFVFDGGSETWSSMASLPNGKERQYATAFSYNGSGYMLGGLYCSNACMKDFWQYSVSTNSWTALPDFPGIGRQGMSNFIIKNKVYVIGGRDQSNTTLNEVWEYNFSTTTWSQKNNLPFAGMWRGAAFSIDTTGYVCYGMNSNANSFNHSIYQYDYTIDSWTIVPNITLPARNYIACAVTNKKACLYGGQDSLNVITNDVKVFDPSDTSLTTLAGVPTIGRKGTMFFALNDVFYISTGLDATQSRIKETWKNTAFVGLKEQTELSVSIFPNPSNDKLCIELISSSNATIQLYNSLGAVVLESIIATNKTEVNTTLYPDGIYLLSVKTKTGISSKKIVIHH
ncbi:MAG: T9SS type A sorting domain-containing protein [Burkholderiales bacterium]|nr:T9SS type A sorting domain-containing protein [Bacteroidia bacterium]